MSAPLISCERGVIPEEVTAEAKLEAYELWDRLYELEEYGIGVQETIPESPFESSLLNFRIRDIGAYEAFGEIAPTTLEILRQLGSASMEGYEVPYGFRSGGITINFMGSGQATDIHQDGGTGDYDRLSCIATLLGKGQLVLLGSFDESDVVDVVDVEEGDVHAFLNPAEFTHRPPHYALNTGDSTRISLGFVIPQLPTSTTTSE